MRTLTRVSVWLGTCICITVSSQPWVTSAVRLQQATPKDTLNLKSSPSPMLKDNNTIKLLPNFNPHKDTAGFQLIPKDFDQMHLSDSNTLPEDFVPYQKAPQILKKVEPVYPKSGIRGALEGKVFVKILVGIDGKAKQVSVMKSDAEIFKKPAVDAAKQFVFAPAYMNNEPVAAWLTYQFQFKAPKRK